MPQRNKKKQTGKQKNKNKKKKQQQKKSSPNKKAQKNKTTDDTESTDPSQQQVTESKNNDTKQKEQQKIVAKREEKKEEKEPTVKDLLFKRPNADKRDPNRSHKFWNKQPVPQMGEKYEEDINGPIEVKTLADVRKQPLLLPPQFEWVQIDLTEDKEVDELYHLLANHYVEDDDNRFRFNYSKAFLKWALMVPGYLKAWHLGQYIHSIHPCTHIIFCLLCRSACG